MVVESSFYIWLAKKINQKTPTGDLARDVKRDRSFPKEQENLEFLHCHLRHNTASPEAHSALDEAFREFTNPKTSRRTLALKVRFHVLKQSNYSCQICGLSASDGARLEVDHKVPVVKGGTDDIQNLWALCFECNRGKGVDEL
jgi:5-methylcytosine-specific restriction endonuclease McrA